jgi:hypothetical protein
LRPKLNRRGSEVPSLVSSESSRDSGLEDLEEEAEEADDFEELKNARLVGKQVGWAEVVSNVFGERFV